MWSILLLLITIVTIIYWYLIRPHRYWSEKGVRQGFTLPLFGDSFGVTFKTESFAEMVVRVYNKCQNTRYSGFYQFNVPLLVLKDPDLIKQITVKDSDHFIDRRQFFSQQLDPLWTSNIFATTGKKWRDLRNSVSPSFSSSKMKFLFSLISKSGQQYAEYFQAKDLDVLEVEMRDVCGRFSSDVIASVVFGVDCDSLNEPLNEFYMMGNDLTNLTGFRKSLKVLMYIVMPSVCRLFRWRFISTNVAEFFTNIVRCNVAARERNNIVRPDMIHLLMQAMKVGLKHEDSQPVHDTGFATVHEPILTKTPKKITEQDIISQATGFFFAAIETMSALLSFMVYEIAVNPNVQSRLLNEIDTITETITYDSILSLKYLDMVVSEALRKWSPAVLVDRLCTKTYTIEPKHPGEKPAILEQGSIVWVPIFGLHRDPVFFPDPEKFDPERFSEQNRASIKPYTYLPFGSGARNCLGSRFALLEAKIFVFYLLSQFEIVPVERTDVPLKISRSNLSLGAENGIWVGLKRRT